MIYLFDLCKIFINFVSSMYLGLYQNLTFIGNSLELGDPCFYVLWMINRMYLKHLHDIFDLYKILREIKK